MDLQSSFVFEVLGGCGVFILSMCFSFVIEENICPLLFIPFFFLIKPIPFENNVCNALFLLCSVDINSQNIYRQSVEV